MQVFIFDGAGQIGKANIQMRFVDDMYTLHGIILDK